jgi:hypothetical protein
LRWLWEEGLDRVLWVLASWERACPDRPVVATAVAYVRDRRARLAYPAFRAAGWPVGSGATESGHKQVMQARMQRAGMRWARAHVSPLLALSLLEHNGRWGTEGSALLAAHRPRRRGRHAPRRPNARLATPADLPPSRAVAPPAQPPDAPPLPASPSPFRHPWRRYGVSLSTTN